MFMSGFFILFQGKQKLKQLFSSNDHLTSVNPGLMNCIYLETVTIHVKLCRNNFLVQLNFIKMKKIFFATLMFLGVAAVSSAKAPVKTANSVSSVSPTRTNSKTSSKHATNPSSAKATKNEAGKKHKKHHKSTSKKAPKK
jgi:hypothetical protein